MDRLGITSEQGEAEQETTTTTQTTTTSNTQDSSPYYSAHWCNIRWSLWWWLILIYILRLLCDTYLQIKVINWL